MGIAQLHRRDRSSLSQPCAAAIYQPVLLRRSRREYACFQASFYIEAQATEDLNMFVLIGPSAG